MAHLTFEQFCMLATTEDHTGDITRAVGKILDHRDMKLRAQYEFNFMSVSEDHLIASLPKLRSAGSNSRNTLLELLNMQDMNHGCICCEH